MAGETGTSASRPAATPRIFTVPSRLPFLDTLARAILDGDLPAKGGAAPGPLALPHWTVLVPTRRAARALRDAFLRVSGADAMLLPAIRPIGDVDEDAALLAPPPEPDAGGTSLEVPDAISALERRLVLTRLILKWAERMQDRFATVTPGQASHLAADLAALMDFAETEGVDLAGVAGLVAGDHAEHWLRTVEFLAIVTEHWPEYLRGRGLLSPYERRDRLLRAATARLAATPPAAPVIAAGSTGTVPATAALLEAIARLPLGAVVLPGLDTFLDEESWQAVADHPEHPQFGMKLLLDRLGVPRPAVALLGADSEPARGRARLVSEVMRPAGTTEKWRRYTDGASGHEAAAAVRGIALIDAPTGEDESEAVALILRRTLEDKGRTAALVTPDRMLARRVCARLEKWGLKIDDSAGRPLARTPPGAFMELVLEALDGGCAPVPLMALLKHPLTRLGRAPGPVRAAARALELAGLRRPYAGAGLEALHRQLGRTRDAHAKGGLRHPAYRRLSPRDLTAAQALLLDFERAVAPLAKLYADGEAVALPALAQAHIAAGEALARDETGAGNRLWRGDDGEAQALLFAGILDAGDTGLRLRASDYPEVYRSLVAGHVVRERNASHPRLTIWGPLEARLQRPDVVVLGGLNEGTWPAAAETSPWLNRPMMQALGLPPPERRIGLAAHDVAQLLGGGEVFLTRAEKIDGAPTVPSRWLLRLQAILKAAGVALETGEWLGWAANRDRVAPAPPLSRPEPRPPVAARPKRLSVTRIEKWIANPYAIFAQDILGLSRLEPLAAEPDARARGELIHEALKAFAKTYPDRLPQRIADGLMALAHVELEKLGGHPRVWAFWQPQLGRFARWFAVTEPSRRDSVRTVHAELSGRLELPALDFILTARADRIDHCDDGSLVLYDYKSGGVPTKRQVTDMRAPQLPLEAAIAAAGGFEGIGAAAVTALRYVRATGRDAGGEELDVGNGNPGWLARQAQEKLTALVTEYAREETPYAALRRPAFANSAQYRYDDYFHLARVAEWLAAAEEAAE